MSFILDALKKSESERQRQSGPALFEVKLAPPRSRFPAWAIGLVLLLGANLLVVGWVLTRSPAERPAAPATPTPATVAAPAAGAAAAGATTPVAAAPVAQPAPPAAASEAPPAGTTAGAIPSHAPPLLEEPVLTAEEDGADDDSFAPPAGAGATATSSTSPSSLPTREDLVTRGASIPELRLDMHVYAARPADRFVFVNMRRLREGEATADGLRVEQITPEGAVLSWQGKRFLLMKE